MQKHETLLKVACQGLRNVIAHHGGKQIQCNRELISLKLAVASVWFLVRSQQGFLRSLTIRLNVKDASKGCEVAREV